MYNITHLYCGKILREPISMALENNRFFCNRQGLNEFHGALYVSISQIENKFFK